MEEGSLDRQARLRRIGGLILFAAYCALVVYLIVNPATRILGVLNVPLVAYLGGRYFVRMVMDDLPQWGRQLAYRGWHGKYREFEGRRIRVIEGERDRPSRVFAADVFEVLGVTPSLTDFAKLEARYGIQFSQGTEAPARGEWLLTDEACLAYARGHMDNQRSERGRTAQRFALWLERTVFMPIDNRRSSQTGRTYAFTRQAARR